MSIEHEIASILKITPEGLKTRVARMRLGETCPRCAGSGRYSFNRVDGDRCFQCRGAGNILPRNAAGLEALKARALVVAQDGTLEAYRAGVAAEKACKDAKKRVLDAWHAVDALNGYDKIWRDANKPEHAEIVRRNKICVDAADRVDLAFTGQSMRTSYRKESMVECPIARLAILESALADIAAVKESLQTGERK